MISVHQNPVETRLCNRGYAIRPDGARPGLVVDHQHISFFMFDPAPDLRPASGFQPLA